MNQAFERLGLPRVINATGTVTRLGASRIDPEVADAMLTAAQCSFDIPMLQVHASAIIAAATGAEAGIVTSGASAALLVGAAACIAGLDPLKMSQLPDTAGLRNEFIISRSHRNSYDHAVRAAGGKLLEVGLPDRLTGCGVRDTEAWEYGAAIGERTAGIVYLARADARPTLGEVVRVAQAANIPVLVDAAAELPPAANLKRFIAEGADLVAFSGGKSIGGPSASGILCGRRPLIASALLQQLDLDYVSGEWQPPSQLVPNGALVGVPRHGIGRSCKVGKEQIAGLLVALQRFAATDDLTRNQHHATLVDALVTALQPLPLLWVRTITDAGRAELPLVELAVSPEASGLDARALASRLRGGTPSVHVDTTSADTGTLILAPNCLTPDDVPAIAAAFTAALARRPAGAQP